MLAVVLLMYLICLVLYIIDLAVVDIVAGIRITLVKDPHIALDLKWSHNMASVTLSGPYTAPHHHGARPFAIGFGRDRNCDYYSVDCCQGLSGENGVFDTTRMSGMENIVILLIEGGLLSVLHSTLYSRSGSESKRRGELISLGSFRAVVSDIWNPEQEATRNGALGQDARSIRATTMKTINDGIIHIVVPGPQMVGILPYISFCDRHVYDEILHNPEAKFQLGVCYCPV
ncbi:hypothetical protein L218DRAFT_943731 [Marasmius fiardii PR-910]|nr:hypothetical protein L218DRAFT_943731 [Marasmius fiardii PR-910]